MITVQYLLDLAIEQEAIYRELSAKFPPGTISRERSDAHQTHTQALIAADWMEKNGIRSALHVGPFSSVTIRAEKPIQIRSGSLILTTHPKGSVISTQSQKIERFHRIDKGYVSERERAVVNPKLVWAGTGGYWRWTDLNNVEQLPLGCTNDETNDNIVDKSPTKGTFIATTMS